MTLSSILLDPITHAEIGTPCQEGRHHSLLRSYSAARGGSHKIKHSQRAGYQFQSRAQIQPRPYLCNRTSLTPLTIQTYIGPMVVSVNPFCSVDHLYSQDKIFEYTEDNPDLPPHLFSVANKAYNHLISLGTYVLLYFFSLTF